MKEYGSAIVTILPGPEGLIEVPENVIDSLRFNYEHAVSRVPALEGTEPRFIVGPWTLHTEVLPDRNDEPIIIGWTTDEYDERVPVHQSRYTGKVVQPFGWYVEVAE